ncbi:hypothetical protein ENBRE01_3238 [Enteropsectra breve]|nr:hypothetical protein ENBRE01_3238 [Enteropsectra breve]
MEKIHQLLRMIEEEIKTAPKGEQEEIKREIEKMYAHYALEICLGKLNNQIKEEWKEGIMRTKTLFKKIEEIKRS